MDIKSGSISDAVDASLFPPQSIKNEILRDALLSTLQEKIISSNNKVIFVKGVEGAGKSVLLNQFLNANKGRSIAIFINLQSNHDHLESCILKDLYVQTSILNGDDPTPENYSENRLISTFQNIQYSLSAKGEMAYFVIDGLDELAKENFGISEKIVRVLPLTSSHFKFIFSSDKGHIEKLFSANHRDSLEVTHLSTMEARGMLPSLESKGVDAVLAVFSRLPSTICQIQRLLESGMQLEDIIQDGDANSVKDLYEIEWKRITRILQTASGILSISAHSDSSLSVTDVAAIENISESDVHNIVNGISIVAVQNDKVSFSSPGLKKFVAEKLSSHKLEACRKLVSLYQAKEKDSFALATANMYMSRSGAHEEVLTQLSNKNLVQIFDDSESINELSKQIEFGASASVESNRHDSLLKFSYLKSFVREFSTSKVLKSEINCYLKTDALKNALDLASSARTNEEKLVLFAHIAGSIKDKGRIIDDHIIDQIEALHDVLDTENLGIETTIDIAISLYPIFPDKSLELINGVDSLGEGGENKSDYAFLRFSMALMNSKGGSFDSLEERLDTVSEKKKEFFSVLSLFKRGTPAKVILSKLEKMEDDGTELSVLRNWIKAFPEMKDNYLLVKRALSLATATSAFSTNSSFYYDASKSIASMDTDQANEIYEKMVSQEEFLRQRGPTLDYIRIQIELTKHEVRIGNCGSRLKKTYDFAAFEVNDKAISLCGLSIIDSYISGSGINTALKSDVKVLKEKVFTELTRDTAFHFTVLKPAFQEECQVDIVNAFQWADRLNIQERRDKAKKFVIQTACESGASLDISRICQQIRSIEKTSARRSALSTFLKHCLNKDSISKEEFKKLKKVKNSVLESASPCPILVSLLEVAYKFDCCSEHELRNLKDQLIEYWENIDFDWNKVNTGFEIHNRLLDYDLEFSERIRENTIDFRESSTSADEHIAKSLGDVLDLSIRAFSVLIKKRIDSKDDLDRLLEAIECLPSNIHRSKELARLASAYQIVDRFSEAIDIVEKHLIPVLDSAKGNDGAYKICLTWSLPIIYKYSRHVFDDVLKEFGDDKEFLDEISKTTIRYLKNKILVGDPIELGRNPVSICYTEIEDIVYLLKKMSIEPDIYYQLDSLSDSISKLIRATKLTHLQKTSLMPKLKSLVEDKFKSSSFISHKGYRICAEVSLLKAFNEKSSEKWGSLIDQANQIGCKSDIALILTKIAASIPTKLKDLENEIYKKAEEIIDTLPSDLDRLCRYEHLAQELQNNYKPRAKQILRKAIKITSKDEVQEFSESRTSLIDLAYSIDSDFASSLGSIFDDDPARREVIEESVKKNKDKASSAEKFQTQGLDGQKMSDGMLPNIAWSYIAKYNAKRHTPSKKIDQLKFIQNISSHDVNNIYPLITYHIANLENRCQQDSQARESIRPVFKSLLECYLLLLEICQVDFRTIKDDSADKVNILVGDGDLLRAAEWVSDFLSNKEVNELVIVDPYFEVNDLEFIGKSILGNPDYTITILTGLDRKESISSETDHGADEILYNFWVENVNSEGVPSITVKFAGLPSLQNKMPIHDRWWLFSNEGLRFGGSTNGLGNSKFQEISRIDTQERINIDNKVAGLINSKQKTINGERIRYQSLSI